MRILWLSSLMPWPLDNGMKVRVYNLLAPLSRRHEITLAGFTDREEGDPDATGPLGDLCRAVYAVPAPQPGDERAGCRPEWPASVQAAYTDRFRDLVERERAREALDVVIVEHLAMAVYAPPGTATARVLSEIDVESLRYRSASRGRGSLRERLWRFRQFRRLVRFEKQQVRAFDLCVTVSEKDRETLARWAPHTRVEHVPIGQDLTRFRPAPDRQAWAQAPLTFCGALNYRPNADAVRYLAGEILPLVRRQVPEARLRVVGRQPPPDLLDGLPSEGIELTGKVDDVVPYFQQAGVFLAPVRIGGGSKVKIIQAMACGLPVVTTPHGASGVDVTPGRDLLVADDAARFAEQVVALLRDREHAARIGAAARLCAERSYDLERIADRYEAMVRETVDGLG